MNTSRSQFDHLEQNTQREGEASKHLFPIHEEPTHTIHKPLCKALFAMH